MPKEDLVNHPKHYTSSASGVECIDIVEHLSFNVGNAIKYLWRAGLKTKDALQDLRKAEWYVAREIKRLSNDQKDSPKEHRTAGAPASDGTEGPSEEFTTRDVARR